MTPSLTFRPVADADYPRLLELARDAFWAFWEPDATITDVPLLVDLLRTSPDLVPELNLVGEHEGRIVAHVLYTRAAVVADDGTETAVVVIGPLAVDPGFQRQGVGRAILAHSFDLARGLGHRAVFLFGSPSYYPRNGFRPASEIEVTTVHGSFDAFQVRELAPGGLDGLRGVLRDAAAYHQVSDEAAVTFDRAHFPPREPHVPVPLDALLVSLPDDAAQSLRTLGLKSVNAFESVSQREVGALPGITPEVLDAIRAASLAVGKPWGAPTA